MRTLRVLPDPDGPMTSMLLLMPVSKMSVESVRPRPRMVSLRYRSRSLLLWMLLAITVSSFMLKLLSSMGLSFYPLLFAAELWT